MKKNSLFIQADPCQRAHNSPRPGGPPPSPPLLACCPIGACLCHTHTMSDIRSPALHASRPCHRPPSLSSSLSVRCARPLFFSHSFTPIQTPPSASPSSPPIPVAPSQLGPGTSPPTPHHPDAVHRPRAWEVPVHRRICADEPPPPCVMPRRRSVRCVTSSPCPACSPLLTHARSASATTPHRPARRSELRRCAGRDYDDCAQRAAS
jgi:hypothetical protein